MFYSFSDFNMLRNTTPRSNGILQSVIFPRKYLSRSKILCNFNQETYD